MTSTNAYDRLYNTMKSNFTVVNEKREYTLGEYMLMKANAKTPGTNLPAVRNADSNAIGNIVTYVNAKLAVKKPPEKDKTIKKFPFRTSISAFVSALITCALIFSFGIFSVNSGEEAENSMIVIDDVYEETADGINA